MNITVNKKEKRVMVDLPIGAFNVNIKNPSKSTSDYFSLNYELPSDNKKVQIISGFPFKYKDFGGRKYYPTNMKIIGNNKTSKNIKLTVEYN